MMRLILRNGLFVIGGMLETPTANGGIHERKNACSLDIADSPASP
jgi:hypothetical protein